MVVNFRVNGINQDARKLVRTPSLIKKIINKLQDQMGGQILENIKLI